jgi:hypothetical protein
MAYTLEQLKELHKDNFAPKRVVSLATAQMEAKTREQVQGNQFQQPENGGILNFGKKAFNAVFGGVKLAEGAGKALSTSDNPLAQGARGVSSLLSGGGFNTEGVQKGLSKTEQQASDIEINLIKKIREQKQAGNDTSRLEGALQQLQEDRKVGADAQQDFVESLPTNKEVIGSSVRLGAAALAPAVGAKMAGVTGAGSAVGVGQGVARGALAGAGTGAITGGISGAGFGLEQNQDAGGIAMSALGGAALGGVSGGAIGGVAGGFVGKANAKVDPATILKDVTPDPAQMTPTQYKQALARGEITPKTATQPAKYVMNDAQKKIALKYQDVIDKDPVKTTLKINDTIADLDDQVGAFLKQNNGVFNKGELRNRLTDSLDELTDITVDPKNLSKAKQSLINNFIDDLDKNDMETLWQSRKAFDQKIEKAFTGSPTLQKELKVSFRNAVQDFIAEGTPDGTYKALMGDMSNLYRLRDTVLTKATKERAVSGIGQWIKNNPIKSKIVGAASLIGGGFFAGKVGIGSSKE